MNDPDWDGQMCGGYAPTGQSCPICRQHTATYVEDETGKLGADCSSCGVITWLPKDPTRGEESP